ncbi:MAG: ribose 5-phosphate isomerase B [Ignavibacteria bacterium]|nr:ribose 5-phosphate isomerase B [Ignavibacteria bacterium]
MKKLITEEDVKAIEKQGSNVLIKTENCIVTPLALDRIRQSKIIIVEKSSSDINQTQNANLPTIKRIAIGSDHTGFKVKNFLLKYLSDKGYKLKDFGTFDEKSCDYPDYAKLVAESVSLGENDFGILIDATGIPSAITANKIKTIRAATCYSSYSAKSSRLHNNSNVLVIGAKSLGEESIKEIVDDYLSTDFEGGRHQKRLDKISEIESK